MMGIILFIIISTVYVTCLAVTDGLFNRLVFGKNRKLPYSSGFKQEIYKSWEWKVIGVIFLIILPVVIPVIITFLIGGINLVLIYLIVLCLVPWDIIFGKIVFDDYLGDTPSIAIPFIGWINLPLIWVYLARLLAIIILTICLYLK